MGLKGVINNRWKGNGTGFNEPGGIPEESQDVNPCSNRKLLEKD
jgi:hypothetical protein